MATIKLTPLLLFLLLLFVLVLSVLFSNWLPLATEGFSSFYQSSPLGATIIIPQYSSTVRVYKVYDNIFFDPNSGNTIIITGQNYVSTVDSSGTSISQVSVIPQIPSKTDISTFKTIYNAERNIIANVKPSLITLPLTSCYTSWTWLTSPYEIIYIPWNTSTFIQIMDISNNKPITVSLFGSGNVDLNYTYPDNKIPSIPTEYGGKDTTQINAYITDVFYDASQSIYAVSDFVKFDAKNGNLILQTGLGSTRTLSVYDYTGSLLGTGTNAAPYKLTPRSISTSRDFIPIMLLDTQGKNLVNYMTMSNKSMISLLAIDPNNSKNYILRNVVRFNPAVSGGIEIANINEDKKGEDKKSGDGDCDSDSDDGSDDGKQSLDSIISDYYKKYWNTTSNQYSDDFLLKTQIIPPICPACSTNCGGRGTTDSAEGTDISGTSNGLGSAVGGIASGVGGAAGGALLGAGALGGGALMGAGALAGGVASGVGDAVGDVAGGVGNAVGGVAGGVGNAVGGIASGVGSIIGGLGQPQQGSYSQQQGQNYSQAYQSQPVQGQSGQSQPAQGQLPQSQSAQGQMPQGQQGYIDNYSRYGALTTKGGNPLPITSDFSKFSK
jgi:hypothetical protein